MHDSSRHLTNPVRMVMLFNTHDRNDHEREHAADSGHDPSCPARRRMRLASHCVNHHDDRLQSTRSRSLSFPGGICTY